MLKKLMKYEFKATGRYLFPLYAALIAFAFIIRVFFKENLLNTINNNSVIIEKFSMFGRLATMISVFAYGFTMATVFVATFLIIVQRFYKNLLGDEGYLMNTLPVKAYLNIINKISVSIIWTILSCFAAFLSLIVLFATYDSFTNIISSISFLITEAQKEFGIMSFIILFEYFILGLIELGKSITMIYASISIGHLFNKSKILLSIGAFIGLSIASNMINSLLLVILSQLPIDIFEFSSIHSMGIVLLFTIIFEGIYLCLYFFITNHIITNNLNLE